MNEVMMARLWSIVVLEAGPELIGITGAPGII